jgi:Ubiquinone biosynthesis hydroxylase, UbiH/UbiF/VisC/COQ6 family
MCSDDNYDFSIIGAGITGSTLALALSKLYKEMPNRPKILLLERNNLSLSENAEQISDCRALAISLGTLRRLESLGINTAFDDCGELIKTIHVSDQGNPGRVQLHACDFGLSHFGKVVRLSEVETALRQQLSDCPEIVQIIRPCSVSEISDACDGKVITASTGEKFSSKVVILAEGGNSQLCQSLGVDYVQRDFKQAAIVTSIAFSHATSGVAWERFTSMGPLAVLPISENWFSVVWSLDVPESSRLMQADEDEFKSELQKAFGFRAGKIEKVGQRQLFPLKESISVRQVIDPTIYLLGNAAHMLHPVAGQGFNLTVRDIYSFILTIAEKVIYSRQSLLPELSRSYGLCRQNDVKYTSRYTSSLMSIFSNSFFPTIVGRSTGLAVIARNRYLRDRIVSLGSNVDLV